MIEYSEKYKSYAEELPDAIVCWKEPAENHTEEGEKIIEAYHQNYLVIAHEIMYEVGDMLAGLCGDDTIQKIYDSYIYKDESKALNKLKKLLGRPIIFPEDSVFYYADTPYKKIFTFDKATASFLPGLLNFGSSCLIAFSAILDNVSQFLM